VLAESDDLQLLEKGAFVYDGFYAWCRRTSRDPHADLLRGINRSEPQIRRSRSDGGCTVPPIT
jgi:hypothetical protein